MRARLFFFGGGGGGGGGLCMYYSFTGQSHISMYPFCAMEHTLVHTSPALPTLYPKSRVVGSGLIKYMELCTVTRNLFIQSECVFSS